VRRSPQRASAGCGPSREASTVDSVEAILALVPQVRWFCAVGCAAPGELSLAAAGDYVASCGEAKCVRWATGWDEAAQVVRGLDDLSSFWKQEDAWRKQALGAVHAAQRSELLAEALHRLSLLGYETVRPPAPDEELARVASGAALWTTAEALTWAAAQDLLAPLGNPFLPKLRLFELGHWPLGRSQGAIVIL
jgi:hypothetical protein